MSQHVTTLFEFSRPRTPARTWRKLANRILMMLDVWRTRRMLATLDARMLKDIGVSRAQARAEAERPLWDIDPYL